MDVQQATIELRPGEHHVLQLPGYGPRGLAWMVNVKGDADVVDVVHESSWSPERGGAPPPPGEGVPQRFTLTARRPGEALVTIDLRAPPLPDIAPERRVEIRLRVGEAQT